MVKRPASPAAGRVVADPRWASIVSRDHSRDGTFVYSVRTTGVYCRPSCPARRPRPEHVDFHDDGAAAGRAGYRPCKRCRPDASVATVRFATGLSTLGAVLVAVNDRGVVAVLLGDDAGTVTRELGDRFRGARLEAHDAGAAAALARVVRLLESPDRGLDLRLDPSGTAFQHRVWRALREIPAGQTVSYAELAATIGAPRAVRAVARACGANPIAVAIPCHRVIRSDGGLSGYRWGLERKRRLLAVEAGA